MTRRPLTWAAGAVASVALHGGLAAMLAAAIAPDPAPEPAQSEPAFDIASYPVRESRATPQPPDAEPAPEGTADALRAGDAPIPMSRAAPAALPDARATPAALPSDPAPARAPDPDRIAGLAPSGAVVRPGAAPAQRLGETAGPAPERLAATAADAGAPTKATVPPAQRAPRLAAPPSQTLDPAAPEIETVAAAQSPPATPLAPDAVPSGEIARATAPDAEPLAAAAPAVGGTIAALPVPAAALVPGAVPLPSEALAPEAPESAQAAPAIAPAVATLAPGALPAATPARVTPPPGEPLAPTTVALAAPTPAAAPAATAVAPRALPDRAAELARVPAIAVIAAAGVRDPVAAATPTGEVLATSRPAAVALSQRPTQSAPLAAEAPSPETLAAFAAAPDAIGATAPEPDRLLRAALPRVDAAPALIAPVPAPPMPPPAQRVAGRAAPAQALDADIPPAPALREATASGTPAIPADPGASDLAALTPPDAVAPDTPPGRLAAAAPALPAPSERQRAATAWSGSGDGALDPVSLAAIQAFAQAGDATGEGPKVRDAISGLLAAVPCARLQTVFDPDTGRLRLRGHVPDEGLREPVLTALAGQVGPAIPLTDEVMILPRPQCGVLAAIEQVGLPQSDDQQGDPRVVGEQPFAGMSAFTEGERLAFEVAGPDYPAYFYVDYFDANGTVIHLQPNEFVPLRALDVQELRGVGLDAAGNAALDIRVGPPFGQEIMVAFASSRPLFDALRPLVEPAAPYLDDLRARVAAARAADPEFRGEWFYFFVTTRAAG